jgi:hypothetical protein
LADSLLQTGWRDWMGLMSAGDAARVLGRFDRQLEYLDIRYATYGNVSGIRADSARAAQYYQRQRAKIIELRDQQQQR